MNAAELIEQYLAGPSELRSAIEGLSAEQLDARPIPGKWSIREVVCHLADYEPVYTDRMKRVIAEDKPPLLGGDPDEWCARLAYAERDVAEELAVMDAVRASMARILRSLEPQDWVRVGVHSRDGELTLETLLSRITGHIPHHLKFIEEKKSALGC